MEERGGEGRISQGIFAGNSEREKSLLHNKTLILALKKKKRQKNKTDPNKPKKFQELEERKSWKKY